MHNLTIIKPRKPLEDDFSKDERMAYLEQRVEDLEEEKISLESSNQDLSDTVNFLNSWINRLALKNVIPSVFIMTLTVGIGMGLLLRYEKDIFEKLSNYTQSSPAITQPSNNSRNKSSSPRKSTVNPVVVQKTEKNYTTRNTKTRKPSKKPIKYTKSYKGYNWKPTQVNRGDTLIEILARQNNKVAGYNSKRQAIIKDFDRFGKITQYFKELNKISAERIQAGRTYLFPKL